MAKADPTRWRVIVTLHGIRTRGEWQKRIAPLIARHGHIPILLDYGFFSVIKFLNPWSRNRVVRWLRDEISQVRKDYQGASISIVAHSLGTYLVARLIEEETDFNFETVLFSGSIVDKNYKWVRLLESNRVKYVANYIAKADIWPKVARFVVSDAGSAGVNGFVAKHPALFEHSSPRYGHSDYFAPHVFERLWLPKLVTPQREMVEAMFSLVALVRDSFAGKPNTHNLELRTRLFVRAEEADTFRQFPGMQFASNALVAYTDDELEYALTPESTKPPIPTCPPAFEAAFSGTASSWSVADLQPRKGNRKDVLAVVGVPLKDEAEKGGEINGLLALEVLTLSTDNEQIKLEAKAIKALLPDMLKEAGTVGADLNHMVQGI